MKRIITALIAAVLLTLAGTGFQFAVANADNGIPLGCPGSDLHGPAAPNASYACPNGGAIVNGVYQATASGGNCGTGNNAVKVSTPGLGCSGSSSNPIYDLINGLVKWLILILVPLAVLTIIISGIQYITSQGNPDGIKGAKSRLTNAIVGLALLLAMRVILQFLGVVQ